VTYFATECREALSAVGLRGFWMGYFGARAAPLGTAGPGLVTATFYNFHPDMVRRSIPDAWGYASPPAILAARRASAAAVLRRLCPTVDEAAAFAVASSALVVERADPAGRALFAANRGLDRPEDEVEALWQDCTSLREHRGDGHVAVLVAEEIDGCEAHLLQAAASGVADQLLRDNRGWSPEEWHDAAGRLATRGLLRDGTLSEAGTALHRHVERRTDELAAHPYAALGARELDDVLRALGAVAQVIVRAGAIPFPNPMGLAAGPQPESGPG